MGSIRQRDGSNTKYDSKRKPKIQQGRKGEYDGPYLQNAPCKAPHPIQIHISSEYIALPVAIPRAGGQIALMLISRKSNRQKFVGISTKQTRLDSYLPTTGPDGFADDSTLIYTIQPNTILLGASNTPIKDHLSKEERELLKNLKPDDNPVLLLERLIDF